MPRRHGVSRANPNQSIQDARVVKTFKDDVRMSRGNIRRARRTKTALSPSLPRSIGPRAGSEILPEKIRPERGILKLRELIRQTCDARDRDIPIWPHGDFFMTSDEATEKMIKH